MKIHCSRRNGLTMVEILIIVAVLAFMTAIALPNYLRDRRDSRKNKCIANLKQIEGAKDAWWIEHHKAAKKDVPLDSDLFGAGKYIKDKPQCPANWQPYTIGAVGTKPTCSVPSHTL